MAWINQQLHSSEDNCRAEVAGCQAEAHPADSKAAVPIKYRREYMYVNLLAAGDREDMSRQRGRIHRY
jgi:hypothetical protein